MSDDAGLLRGVLSTSAPDVLLMHLVRVDSELISPLTTLVFLAVTLYLLLCEEPTQS